MDGFEPVLGGLSGNWELMIINSSTTKKAEEMSKLISELLYRVNPSILQDLINYKNDLLALEDILKELDKDLK